MSDKAQQKLVDDWNREYDRGQKVLVRLNNEGVNEYEDVTHGLAYINHGRAVVYLDFDIEVPLEIVRAMMPCLYCQHSLAEPFPFETDKGEAVCQHCGEERNMH